MIKRALVLGAGGFIGSHMVKRLKAEGYWVRGVDIKEPEFSPTQADQFLLHDLRNIYATNDAFKIKGGFDEVYQFAADMGGAGYIFSGENDAEVFNNSMRINLNTAEAAVNYGVKKLFFSSSACIYPQELQEDPNNHGLKESDAYPANPDSAYGWEKIAAEQLYDAYRRNYNLDVRIARFHNIYGPEGTYQGGREKAPAAMCRKAAEAIDGGFVEVWGDGKQTRSFLYIDDCIEAVRKLMYDIEGDWQIPPPIMNIGSEEMVSINHLAEIAIGLSGKKLRINNISSNNLGVRGRSSDNKTIRNWFHWEPKFNLIKGLGETYDWIAQHLQGSSIKESLQERFKDLVDAQALKGTYKPFNNENTSQTQY